MNIDPGYLIYTGLVLTILYMIFVPPKWFIDRFNREQAIKAAKATKDAPHGIFVTGIEYARGGITGYFTRVNIIPLVFERLSKGDHSQTVFINVDKDGNVIRNETEASAQVQFKEGDLGILAVTCSRYNVQFRSISPKLVDPKNHWTVRLHFMPMQ